MGNNNTKLQISVGERMCKKSVEKLTSKKFHKVRPDFLRNPTTGRSLELDMYNEELKLAVEYNGIQHYKYTSKFHKSEIEFIKQQQRDKVKKKLCKQHGIKLIIVPYTVKHDNIHEYLRFKLGELNLLKQQWCVLF